MTAARQLDFFNSPTPREEAPRVSAARAPGTPGPAGSGERTAGALTPEAQRDDVLEALATKRTELVRVGIQCARDLCRLYPQGVTMAEVRMLIEKRRPELLDGVDPRALGAVLLPSNGFERTGASRNSGSRARPQPVWRVK